MTSDDEILNFQHRLKLYRRSLAHYLSQQAQHGSAYTPPAIIHGIEEARENIVSIKRTLRSWGIKVDDHPDDNFQAHHISEQSPVIGVSAKRNRTASYILKHSQKRRVSTLFLPLIGVLAVTSILYFSGSLARLYAQMQTQKVIYPATTFPVLPDANGSPVPANAPSTIEGDLSFIEALQSA